ncbi:MAG: glycosyltransferase family 4 protein [Actinobacteria bacterium]|nr:glycosyltransferase family 4 protein [Actinomycetota bacterium]
MSVSSVRFIGHDASRTGAPASLLEFLRWMKHSVSAVETSTVLLGGGPLLDEFEALGPTSVAGGFRRFARRVPDLIDGFASSRVTEGASHLVSRSARWSRDEVDVEVVNTLAGLDGTAGRCGRRVVIVHELDGVADRVLPSGSRRTHAAASVDHWLAAGPAVRSMLVDRWGIDPTRVTEVPEIISPYEVAESSLRLCRQRSGTTGGRPLVVSCGEASTRKGSDRFIDLLRCLGRHEQPPVGVWVGGSTTTVGWRELEFDRRAAGLGDRCVVLETTDDARAWIAAADVVVSTAREDPYPLVVLEAASSGRAVVAMDSGGVRSMLERAGHGDLVVAQGDVLGMADIVGGLIDDPDRRAGVGGHLAETLGSSHLPDEVAPLWWSAITDLEGVT